MTSLPLALVLAGYDKATVTCRIDLAQRVRLTAAPNGGALPRCSRAAKKCDEHAAPVRLLVSGFEGLDATDHTTTKVLHVLNVGRQLVAGV